jgi:SAM-dependent methyltransferase
MTFRLNSTEEYHRGPLDTLGWELTVCNSLQDAKSPCRRVLKHSSTFGEALYRHLSRFFPLGDITRVIEIGGGYGNLMADFTRLNPRLRPFMLDLSPVLLSRQIKALAGTGAEFLEADFFSMEPGFFSPFELAVLNENCGDFPALCDVPAGVFDAPRESLGAVVAELVAYYDRYAFERPAGEAFNFNLGAVRALETLCDGGVPRIYLSEHSCEAAAPAELAEVLDIVPSMNPEPIALKGHVEYTVRFSHLEKVALRHGYSAKRGSFADFLEVDFTPEINFILRSRSSKNDEHEIIRQFIGDLYKYEYLVLEKGVTV